MIVGLVLQAFVRLFLTKKDWLFSFVVYIFLMNAIGSAFANFLSPVTFMLENLEVWKKKFYLMYFLKMFGLLFLIIFNAITLELIAIFRTNLFILTINEAFIILAFIGGGLYVLLLLLSFHLFYKRNRISEIEIEI